MRRALLGVLFCLPAFGAQPALADSARPWVPVSLTAEAAAPHVVVHYAPAATAPERAERLAATAERIYALEVGAWGFPAPVDDGDGRTDLYLYDVPGCCDAATYPDPQRNGRASASIALRPGADDGPTVAHEFFHVLQFSMWGRNEAGFLVEASAQWAYARVAQPNGNPRGYWLQPQVPLDCLGLSCGPTRYEQEGYWRWPFLEFLTERYGMGLLREVYAQRSPDAAGALDAALQLHGTTLGREFADFTFDSLDLVSSWTAARPLVYTGTASGALTRRTVEVDHLAAGLVVLAGGGRGSGSGRCGPATLDLTVTLPPGIGARPYFFSRRAGPAVALPVEGGRAMLDVPGWSTCPGAADGVLALVNPSVGANAQRFSVEATLETRPAAPPRVQAAVAPDERPSARRGGLALAVRSSAAGRLDAELLSTGVRRSFELHAGENTLWLTLPARLRPGRKTLILTPLSTSGERGRPSRLPFVLH